MTKSYEELLTDMTEIIAKIHDKGYDKGYQQGKFDAEMEAKITKPAREFLEESRRETVQENRDRIVEKAKKDVRKLVDDAYRGEGHATGEFPAVAHIGHVKTEFIVNKEKRTVVALLRYKYITDGIVRLKGIAKCAPDDCFNAHIGKAIALRRALGLDVPDEYYTAPQPTEVCIGDVVSGNRERGPYAKNRHFTLTGISTEAPTVHKKAYTYKEDNSDWIYEDQIGVIIDDSREGGVN